MLTAERSDEAEEEEKIQLSNPSASVRARAILQSIVSNKGALIGAIIVSIFAIVSIVEYLGQRFGLKVTPYNPIAIGVGPALSAILKLSNGN